MITTHRSTSKLPVKGVLLYPSSALPVWVTVLARWLAGDRNITIEYAGNTLNDLSPSVRLSDAATALATASRLTDAPTAGQVVIPPHVESFRRAMLSKGLSTRLMPLSRALTRNREGTTAAAAEASQVSMLLSALAPYCRISSSGDEATPLSTTTDGASYPIRRMQVTVPPRAWFGSADTYAFAATLKEPTAELRDTQPFSMLSMLRVASYIALVEAFPKFLARRELLTEPLELGNDKETMKDRDLRTAQQYAKSALLLFPFALVPYVAIAKIFIACTKIPLIAAEIERLSGSAEMAEWKEAASELAKMPLPPMVNLMLRSFYPSNLSDSPWGTNPAYPLDSLLDLLQPIAAGIVDEEQLRSLREAAASPAADIDPSAAILESIAAVTAFRGALLPPSLTRIEVRSALAARLNGKLDYASWVAARPLTQLRVITMMLYDWLKNTGGNGIASNQVLLHYQSVANICGWGVGPEVGLLAPTAMMEDPIVTDGAASTSPVHDSFELLFRRLLPYDISYGRLATFGCLIPRTINDKTLDRYVVDSPDGGGQKALDLMACHYIPHLWLTNSEGRTESTLATMIDPREFILESEHTASLFGVDAMKMDNSPTAWAAYLGISEAELTTLVRANPPAWSHLVNDTGFIPGSVLTSSSIRALGLNIAVRLPFFGIRSVLLTKEERIYDAYDFRKDQFARFRDRPLLRASNAQLSSEDLTMLGWDPQAWTRRT